VENSLLARVADKTLTKEELRQKVEQNFNLLVVLLKGTGSPKAVVRYGCAKVLMDLSEAYPEKLYPYWNEFIILLDSKYRILTWNAMAIIANLTKVDKQDKLDTVFDKYYSFLNNDYMVSVANVVGNSAKIALAKPKLIPRITAELLNIENVSVTPHLTEECKLVIAEKAVVTFGLFFDKIEENEKKKVLSFVKRQIGSPRKTLRAKAAQFLKKWG
jgi:nitrate reductase NapAB chaperone NapD